MKTKREIWNKVEYLEKQIQRSDQSSIGKAFATGILKTWREVLLWVLEEGE